MKRADLIITAVFLLFALASVGVKAIMSYADKGTARVEIYVEGELYKTVLLYEGEQQVEIHTASGSNTVAVYSDGVRVVYADCASQACVNTGKVSTSGGVIACLPHRMMVKLAGDMGGGLDAVAR